MNATKGQYTEIENNDDDNDDYDDDLKESIVNEFGDEESSPHSNVLLSDDPSPGNENFHSPTQNGKGIDIPSDNEDDESDDMVLVDDEFNPLTPGGEHKRIVSGFGLENG